MSELQATIEFSVEVSKFFNVDLFQRGYYQIRTTLKTSPKLPAKIEVTLPKASEESFILPSCVINGTAVSKTFQILYRNEDVTINDLILYRLHTLIDSNRIEECIERADLRILLELCFSEEDCGPQVLQDKMESVSQRTLQLNFSPTKGLHHYVPVLFDYFHLCAVEVTVHGTLIALHQPYINLPRPPKSAWANKPGLDLPSTLEMVYFGSRTVSGDPINSSTMKLHNAFNVHKRICKILLSAYESLQCVFDNYLSKIPGAQFKLEMKDCHKRLESVVANLQNFDNEEDLLQTATTDITQLCAENVILWTQFLEVVSLERHVLSTLSQEHHVLRVKRMAEGFFTNDYSKPECLSCYEPSFHGHSDLTNLVKNSEYFQHLPSLPVQCLDLDGDHTTLPIIYEDVYCDHIPMTNDDSKPARSVAGLFQIATNKSPDTSKSNEIVDPIQISLVDKNRNQSSRDKEKVKQNSSGSQESSQKFKQKRKFIKNIRPDAFRRPSYSMSEADAIKAKDPQQDCTLIGYRKKEFISDLSDPQGDKSVQLGTFSPAPSSIQDNDISLTASSSMPSFFVRSSWSRTSINSLPELMDNRSSPNTRRRIIKSAVFSKELKQLKADLKRQDNTNTGGDEIEKKSVEEDDPEGDNTLALLDDEKIREKLGLTDIPPDNFNELNKQENDSQEKRPLNALADDISKALGDGNHWYVTSNTKTNDDVSDDDTCVANGYDSVLEKNNPRDKDDILVSIHSREMLHSEKNAEQDQENCSTQSLSSESEIVTQGLENTDKGLDKKLTVIEFLKQEYGRYPDKKKIVQLSAGNSPCKDVSVEASISHRASSDTNLFKSIDNSSSSNSEQTLASDSHGSSLTRSRVPSSFSFPELSKYSDNERPRLVTQIGHHTLSFVKLRENLKKQMKYNGQIYSEFARLASTIPYFQLNDESLDDGDGVHLVVCVHGLDGNSADLRLFRTYIEMAMPGYRIEFLMSDRNQDTFADFDVMSDRLTSEILSYIEMYGISPTRVSFVGHSLGNLIIRSVVCNPKLAHLVPKLYTFLSLSGPHLGTLYNSSGLVNMGMWFMQKWKKSGSLLQLSLKDHPDPRQTFLYKLSQKPGLEMFRNVLLVGSSQDRYVPYHSSRIEMCKAAQRESSGMGAIYSEMVANILTPVVNNPKCKLVRYDVFHALPNTANTIIGRAAHIAVLDSELFIEKFLTVAGLKYLK